MHRATQDSKRRMTSPTQKIKRHSSKLSMCTTSLSNQHSASFTAASFNRRDRSKLSPVASSAENYARVPSLSPIHTNMNQNAILLKNLSPVSSWVGADMRSKLGSRKASDLRSTGSARSDKSSVMEGNLRSTFSKSCLNIKLGLRNIDVFEQFVQSVRRPSTTDSPLNTDFGYVDTDFVSGNNELDFGINCQGTRRRSFILELMSNASSPRRSNSNEFARFPSSFQVVPTKPSFTGQGGISVPGSKLHYATHLVIGERRGQEDRVSIVQNLRNANSTSLPLFFAGVFDGFGGDLVSEYVARRLPLHLARSSQFPLNIRKAMKQGIFSVNKKFLKKAARSVLKDRESDKAEYLMKSFLRTRQGNTSMIMQYHTAGATGVFLLVETVPGNTLSGMAVFCSVLLL